VQHVQSDDHGLTVAQAIAQGTAVTVSDDSLRYTLGTSAFVIKGATPDHHVLGYNRVPGPVEEGDSHRCELAGLCAIVTTVNCLCRLHSVTNGLITIACDNTSALKPTAVDFLPHPGQKNLDLMQALWRLLQESPVTWQPVHVYGHQDRNGPSKITSPSRPTLCGLIMDPVTQMWWVRHKRLPLEAEDTIDWKACSEGMPALNPSR